MNELGIPDLKKTLPTPLYKERLLSFLQFSSPLPRPKVSQASPLPKLKRRSRKIVKKTSGGILQLCLNVAEPLPKKNSYISLLESRKSKHQKLCGIIPSVKENNSKYSSRQPNPDSQMASALSTPVLETDHVAKPLEKPRKILRPLAAVTKKSTQKDKDADKDALKGWDTD